MVRISLFLLAIFISINTFSKTEKVKSKISASKAIFYSNGFDKLEMVLIDRKTVSKKCIKKNSTCQAILKLKEKIVENSPTHKDRLHPASEFCFEAKGVNLILKSEKNQEYDFCKFDDNSMIDSWDLYYAHHPKNPNY